MSVSAVKDSETTLRVSFTGSIEGVPDVSGYQYSTDGTNFSNAAVTDGAFVIGGLSAGTPYTVRLRAYSDTAWTSSVTTASPVKTYMIGTAPSALVLSPVYGSESSLRLYFTDSSGGYPPVSGYKYKLSTETEFRDATASPIIISDLSAATSYTVNIKAISTDAWESSTVSATASTYKKGSIPSITIDSSINAIVVHFTQSEVGIPSPSYYYSYSPDGSNRIAVASTPSSFNISTRVPKTVYFIADSSSGTLISAGVTGTPYVLGSVPSITNIVPGLNKLTVSFSSSTGGYRPPTYYYYYSYNSTTSARTAVPVPAAENSFDIPDLSNAVPYSVYMVASNEAGDVISDPSSATPYVIATSPTITSVTPGVNSLSIHFNNSTGGNPAPYYYYSYDGGATFANSTYTSNATPISITGLYSKSYSIQLKGVSAQSGNTEVSSATGVPYVLGTAPNMTIANGRGKITVGYSQDISGTYDTTWYYSLNGSALISSPTTPFELSGEQITGTSPYSIYVLVRNPAGDLSTNIVRGNVFGSDPSFSVMNYTGKITVAYSQNIPGTTPTTWYYSLNGSALVSSPTTPFDLSGAQLTGTSPYSIYMLARNPAGDLSTNVIQGNTLGSKPIITSITTGSNAITVNYSQEIVGTAITDFYYYLNDVSYNALASGFTIEGLTNTTPYTIRISAVNPAGTIDSDTSNVTVLGSKPVITSIVPGSNQATIYYSQEIAGTANTIFYYYLNGVSYNAPTSGFTISGLSNATPNTIRISAVNPAGTIDSVTSNIYVFGDKPVITSIVPGFNQATIYYSQANAVTADTKFYYYLNGVSYDAPESGFTISDLTRKTPYSFRISAVNPAGNIESDSSYINVFGSKPTATVTSGTNKITVQISQIVSGTSATKYYYSEFPDGSSRQGTGAAVFDISNITKAKTFYVVASNPAGNLVSDLSFTGIPYAIGSSPRILFITPVYGPAIQRGINANVFEKYFGRVAGGIQSNSGERCSKDFNQQTVMQRDFFSANTVEMMPMNFVGVVEMMSREVFEMSLTVYFIESEGGYPAVQKYQYSLDGGETFADANELSSPIIITGLYSDILYSVSIRAVSNVGSAWSSESANSKYETGSDPVIGEITPGLNQLSVAFSQTPFGTSPTTYYYSTDGINILGNGTSASPLIISDISMTITFYLMAINPEGNTRSASSATGTPYSIGSTPTILYVTAVENNETTLLVYFAESVGGYPALIKYQYSLNGGSFKDAVGTSSPIAITKLTAGTSYLVRLKAVSGSIWSSEVAEASGPVKTFQFINMFWSKHYNMQRHCANQVCQKQVLYNKLKTGGNDASISCRMKYAQTVNIAVSGAGGMCTKTLDPNGNVVKK